MSTITSSLGQQSSLKVEIPLESEQAMSVLPKHWLCQICYLQPETDRSFSTSCHCIEVLSSTRRMDVTLESQSEMKELFKELKAESSALDLAIVLTYKGLHLDSDLLDQLGNLLLTKNIVSLRLSINYIYNEHKEEDNDWKEAVKRFASALEKNSTLKILDLSGTHLTFTKDLIVPLKKNTTLLSLNLKNAAIGGHEDQIRGVKEAFGEYGSLKSLNLSGNYIRMIDLTKKNTLAELDLSENLLSEEAVVAVAKALKLSGLKSFSLAENKLSPKNVPGISPVGVIAFGVALEENPALEYINLSHNNIDGTGITYIAKGLKKNSKLKFLDISHNPSMGDQGGNEFGQALKKNKTLILLNLSHTNVGDAGVEQIAKALETNDSLQILNLSGNSGNGSFSGPVDVDASITFHKTTGIGIAGGQALGRALETNCGLHLLNIGGCSIDTEGMLAIANGLKHHSTLKSFIANGNAINNAVAKEIANFLEANPLLRSLDLQRGWFGDDGLVAIAQALCTNTHLVHLDVRNNYAGSPGIKAIAEALEKNRTLRSLYLGGKFEEAAIMAVLKALGNNTNLSEKLQNFDISWRTNLSTWFWQEEQWWDSEFKCLKGLWSYDINGTTIASAESYSEFFEQIKKCDFLPPELLWLHDISLTKSTSTIKKSTIISALGTKILSSNRPEPRKRDYSSSTRPFCDIL